MKTLNLNGPLALQTLHRRSPIHRAIDFYHIRAASCAPTCLAALLLTSIPTANAAYLGRLFFTPAQRAQLDFSYARNATAEGSGSPVLTVNGIVQKNGGERTVWINGVSQNAGNSGERNPTAQTVTIPGKSRPVKLKVGDKILLDQSSSSAQGVAGE